MKLQRILLASFVSLCTLEVASAQASFHRADFVTPQNEAILAAFTIGTDHSLSVFIDPSNEVTVQSARLELGGTSLSIPLTGACPAHGEIGIEQNLIELVRSGAATLKLTTSRGQLGATVVDPGLASYGTGGAVSGAVPTLSGLGHAVAEGTLAVVANGLTPGRLGAFVFSATSGTGAWGPGVPSCIGAAISTDLRVPDASGRAEWRATLPPWITPGATLFVQYVEIDGSTVTASTNGVRIQVRPAAPLVVQQQAGHIVTRLASGYVVTSAVIGPDGLADPATQTFFDQTPQNDWTTSLPAAVLAHPALNVAVAPLQGFTEPGTTGLSLAEEEQRALIGGFDEILGPWSLGWVTDGCSFIRFKTKFEDCCDLHDMLYDRGGNEADRKAADDLLAECVAQRTGNLKSAQMVYDAVRTWGKSHFRYHGPQ